MVSRWRMLPSTSALSFFCAMGYKSGQPLESSVFQSRGCGRAVGDCANAGC